MCKVKGKPEPKVEWFKDDRPVDTDNRVKIDYDGLESTLIIKDAVLDDEGDYKCIITNDVGSVSTTAEVLVNEKEEPAKPIPKLQEKPLEKVIKPQEELPIKTSPVEEKATIPVITTKTKDKPIVEEVIKLQEELPVKTTPVEEKPVTPVIKTKIEDKETDLGTTAKFTVEVEGTPTPEVDWYKDDKIIEDKGRFIIVDDETDKGVTSSLVIEDVKPDDSGVYNAVAFNDEGEVTTEATLKVVDKPKSIVEPEIAPEAEQEIQGKLLLLMLF